MSHLVTGEAIRVDWGRSAEALREPAGGGSLPFPRREHGGGGDRRSLCPSEPETGLLESERWRALKGKVRAAIEAGWSLPTGASVGKRQGGEDLLPEVQEMRSRLLDIFRKGSAARAPTHQVSLAPPTALPVPAPGSLVSVVSELGAAAADEIRGQSPISVLGSFMCEPEKGLDGKHIGRQMPAEGSIPALVREIQIVNFVGLKFRLRAAHQGRPWWTRNCSGLLLVWFQRWVDAQDRWNFLGDHRFRPGGQGEGEDTGGLIDSNSGGKIPRGDSEELASADWGFAPSDLISRHPFRAPNIHERCLRSKLCAFPSDVFMDPLSPRWRRNLCDCPAIAARNFPLAVVCGELAI